MRDYPLMGSTTVTSGVSIPRQTHPATDTGFALFQGYVVRSDGELLTIQ